MIRALACVFALLAAWPAAAQTLAALAPAGGPPRPALRAATTVTDDVVRIGDLIDNAGIVANVPIFRSPDPGTTGRVSAAAVIAAVEAHALIGLSTNGIRDISVTRPGRQVAAGELEAQLAAALAARYGLGSEKDIEIRFDNAPEAVKIDADADSNLNILQLTYLMRSGRFEAVVEIGDRGRRLRLAGIANATAEIVTLNRALSRGEVVRASDIMIERRPRAQVNADMIADPKEIVGRAARSSIGSGRPLRATDLTKPQLVQRNEVVTLIYEVPGITLTVRGKAHDGGAEGDVIEVLNVQSKRAIHGVITGPGRVTVSSLTAGTIIAGRIDGSLKSNSATVRAQ
ncbi:MAG: flagellar basal body P-ring formation chaperone FlgA [Pseudolabrys sp.]